MAAEDKKRDVGIGSNDQPGDDFEQVPKLISISDPTPPAAYNANVQSGTGAVQDDAGGVGAMDDEAYMKFLQEAYGSETDQ